MIKDYLHRYPLTLLAAAAITIASLIPIPEVKLAEDVPLADKWVHMIMYGTLTLIIWVEYLRQHHTPNWSRLILLGVAAPIVMSGIIELMQAYLTTCRSGEWLDLAANTIGVALGTLSGLCFHTFLLYKKGRPKK
ncbi:MAG: VanZ family protein [Bacteroidaceae bacterium]|nr:VanZ family protein [Bacteroidaceae bacterium]